MYHIMYKKKILFIIICNFANRFNILQLVNKTPKKFLKQDSRLIMPSVQSPAGPSAVRSPAFQLSGYVVFSLKEIHRQQFTLNKVNVIVNRYVVVSFNKYDLTVLFTINRCQHNLH